VRVRLPALWVPALWVRVRVAALWVRRRTGHDRALRLRRSTVAVLAA
jgi:hypothetical protein